MAPDSAEFGSGKDCGIPLTTVSLLVPPYSTVRAK